MATEAEIRGAERARLEAIVAEAGTERERFELLMSGVMRNGVSPAQWEGSAPLGYLAPAPEVLARLARRVERRSRFGLPADACGGSPPTHTCSCLELALDATSRGGKRAVLKMAAGFHWSPPARTERVKPEDESSVALVAQEAVPEAAPDAPPLPKPEPEPERPFRIVKHFRRWYDGAERFSDMRF